MDSAQLSWVNYAELIDEALEMRVSGLDQMASLCPSDDWEHLGKASGLVASQEDLGVRQTKTSLQLKAVSMEAEDGSTSF